MVLTKEPGFYPSLAAERTGNTTAPESSSVELITICCSEKIRETVQTALAAKYPNSEVRFAKNADVLCDSYAKWTKVDPDSPAVSHILIIQAPPFNKPDKDWDTALHRFSPADLRRSFVVILVSEHSGTKPYKKYTSADATGPQRIGQEAHNNSYITSGGVIYCKANTTSLAQQLALVFPPKSAPEPTGSPHAASVGKN